MALKYIVVKSEYKSDSKMRIGYGIAVIDDSDEIISVLHSIYDISSNLAAVENLVENCNKAKLSPIHLRDVAIDILGEI